MRKSLYTLTILAFAFGGSTACATKGFVKNEVSQVSSKVDTLSQSLEETQQRTKQNEAKINDVDGESAVGAVVSGTGFKVGDAVKSITQ